MNKKCINILFVLMMCFSLAGNAFAASKVLLLPFAVNAQGKNTVQASLDELFTNSLRKSGLQVVKRNIQVGDVASARAAARNAGADYALYGTYNQVGESFDLDMRFVTAKNGVSRSISKQGAHLLMLSSVVDDSVKTVNMSMRSKGGIQDIVVRGTLLIDPERIKNVLVSRIGDTVDAEKLDEDIRAVWAMGYFNDVTAYVDNNDVLIVDVVEKPRINAIRVLGDDAVSEEDALGAIQTQPGKVLNEKTIINDLEIIKELYRKQGYYLVDTKYNIQPTENKKGANLIINVEAGNKLYVKEVNMIGVDEDMQDELRKVTKIRKHHMFSWFTKYGILKEEDIEGDTQQVQGYLVQSGYLDAIAARPEIFYEEDGIIVNFNISPGIRYKIGQIGFRGDLLESTDELYEKIKLDNIQKDEEYFNLTAMQDDIQTLKDLYTHYGYAFANVDVDTPLDKANGLIDVYFILQPNEKVYIRNVIIEGNHSTRDNVILRELRLADGQAYDGSKVQRSIDRLNMTSYFKEVNVDLLPTGVSGEVDMKLSVVENDTGRVGLGIGYSTYDNIGVSANIQKDNLFGKGYSVGLQGYVSSKKSSMRGYFVNPRVNDTNLGFTANIYSEDYEWSSYDRKATGTELGVFYPIGEYTRIVLNYKLEFYEMYNIQPYASSAIKSYEGNNWASVASTGIVRDTTNSSRFPTRGTKESIFVEYGGGVIGGTDDFIKVRGSYGAYLGLGKNHVLHGRISGVAVYKNGDDPIPAFERVYIGGMSTLRGYDYEDASTLDPRTQEVIGATKAVYGSVEYIWRISEEYSIAAVPFFDFATLSDETYETLFDKNFYSAGLEVRWNSPLGDLRFAYGFPLTDAYNGESLNGRFEFTMGRAF